MRTRLGPSRTIRCSVTVPAMIQPDTTAVIGAIATQERPMLEAFLDYYRAVVVARYLA